MDDDNGKRNVQPVTLTPLYSDNGYKNVLNMFKEHTCDGIYPGLFRLARFAALVSVEADSTNTNGNTPGYDIQFTGTVPDTMQFKLQSAFGVSRKGMVIQVRYNKKNTFAISKDDELVEALTFDENSGEVPPVPTEAFCGENRYLPLENTLQFYITLEDDCLLDVMPLDVVRASIRMQWTLDEFYAEGGTTNFVDRLAGSLGIHASNIKVVTVYEGSVVVEFEIYADEADSSNADSELEQVQALLESLLADDSLDLGVTILGASISDNEVDFYKYDDGNDNSIIDTYIDNSIGEVTERMKNKSKDEGLTTLGYVVIVLSLVLLAAILGMAYMYIKGKQAANDRKAVDQDDRSNTSPNMSEASENFER
eukprot:scpid3684/ scgid8813/ 